MFFCLFIHATVVHTQSQAAVLLWNDYCFWRIRTDTWIRSRHCTDRYDFVDFLFQNWTQFMSKSLRFPSLDFVHNNWGTTQIYCWWSKGFKVVTNYLDQSLTQVFRNWKGCIFNSDITRLIFPDWYCSIEVVFSDWFWIYCISVFIFEVAGVTLRIAEVDGVFEEISLKPAFDTLNSTVEL